MKHKKELTFTNDAINVVYTNNITNTNNYRPMTAWIMAHRLEHIFLSSDYTVCSALMAELSTLICRTINIYNPAYSENQVTDLRNFYNVSNTNVRILYEFVYKVFTMRSARNKNISSVFDYNAELFAQWLLTGSIKFNTVPKSIITVASAKSQFDDREKCIVHEISELQQKLLTAEWNRLAVKLGEYYDILMQDSIGKVLCW